MGPPAFRATFAGLVYQVGNVRLLYPTCRVELIKLFTQMVSAASAQIEASRCS